MVAISKPLSVLLKIQSPADLRNLNSTISKLNSVNCFRS